MTRKQRGIRTSYLLQLMSVAVTLSCIYFCWFAYEHHIVWGEYFQAGMGAANAYMAFYQFKIRKLWRSLPDV